MIEYVVAFLALGYGFIVVRDFHRFIKKSHAALDCDQDILDQITVHEPQPDDDDDGPQFAIDMDWDEQTAVLEFIDQFRAIRAHHERRQP